MAHFLVTMEHAPDSCAFTDRVRRQRALDAATGMSSLAQSHGIAMHSAVANVVGHRTYLHVEAPDAAAIERLLIDTGLFAQNTCAIEAVRPMPEVAQLLAATG